ncbi:hypothetical protein BHE74_00023429 [Ensete ventricosum]|nr:hypothetical protein BHE74_00023429 [Ensete ventricosum]RZS01862.1 hypothetical protein BHM03_00031803 [Ensete ventricosum]
MTRPPTGATDHALATYMGAAYCSQGPQQRGGEGQPTKGGAHPRPGHMGNRLRVVGYSSAPARGGSRSWLGRRSCYQWPADSCPRPARKGRPAAGAAPVGRQLADRGTARKGYNLQGWPLAGADASKGSACRGVARGGAARVSVIDRRGGRPLAVWLPRAWAAIACIGAMMR